MLGLLADLALCNKTVNIFAEASPNKQPLDTMISGTGSGVAADGGRVEHCDELGLHSRIVANPKTATVTDEPIL